MGDGHIFPVSQAWVLDNWFMRLFQNPKGIIDKYIRPGFRVLDFGCASGMYSREIAKRLEDGLVVSADCQKGMLDLLKKKIEGTEIENRIKTHLCKPNKIGLKEKFDFILALNVIHETPNKKSYLEELYSLMKNNSNILIIEPKAEVSRKEFEEMLRNLERLGLKIISRKDKILSREVVLRK